MNELKFQRKEIRQNFVDNLLVAYQNFKSEVMFLTLDTFQTCKSIYMCRFPQIL